MFSSAFKQIWKKGKFKVFAAFLVRIHEVFSCCSELRSLVLLPLHLSLSPETSLSASHSSICWKFLFSFEMISQQADLCRIPQPLLPEHTVTHLHYFVQWAVSSEQRPAQTLLPAKNWSATDRGVWGCLWGALQTPRGLMPRSSSLWVSHPLSFDLEEVVWKQTSLTLSQAHTAKSIHQSM